MIEYNTLIKAIERIKKEGLERFLEGDACYICASNRYYYYLSGGALLIKLCTNCSVDAIRLNKQEVFTVKCYLGEN